MCKSWYQTNTGLSIPRQNGINFKLISATCLWCISDLLSITPHKTCFLKGASMCYRVFLRRIRSFVWTLNLITSISSREWIKFINWISSVDEYEPVWENETGAIYFQSLDDRRQQSLIPIHVGTWAIELDWFQLEGLVFLGRELSENEMCFAFRIRTPSLT